MLPTPRLAALAAEFTALPEGPERYKLLLQYANALPPFPAAARSLENRVMGCTSQTWLTADLGPDGAVRVAGACLRRLAASRRPRLLRRVLGACGALSLAPPLRRRTPWARTPPGSAARRAQRRAAASRSLAPHAARHAC